MMNKKKTIEENFEEAAYRAQEHLYGTELRNGIDPDWSELDAKELEDAIKSLGLGDD